MEQTVNYNVLRPERRCYVGEIMDELTHVSRAEEYRNSAAALRLLARETRSPEIRDDLLKLATGFERLAGWIEAREAVTADAAGRSPSIRSTIGTAFECSTSG